MRHPQAKRFGGSDWPSTRKYPLIEETHGWRQGGAETYIYRFKVITAERAHDVLLKAVTAFSTSQTLGELADEWIGRRRLLAEAGVCTPTLYFAGRASWWSSTSGKSSPPGCGGSRATAYS